MLALSQISSICDSVEFKILGWAMGLGVEIDFENVMASPGFRRGIKATRIFFLW